MRHAVTKHVELSADWWSAMSYEQRRKYIQDHPNSKYAKAAQNAPKTIQVKKHGRIVNVKNPEHMPATKMTSPAAPKSMRKTPAERQQELKDKIAAVNAKIVKAAPASPEHLKLIDELENLKRALRHAKSAGESNRARRS